MAWRERALRVGVCHKQTVPTPAPAPTSQADHRSIAFHSGISSSAQQIRNGPGMPMRERRYSCAKPGREGSSAGEKVRKETPPARALGRRVPPPCLVPPLPLAYEEGNGDARLPEARGVGEHAVDAVDEEGRAVLERALLVLKPREGKQKRGLDSTVAASRHVAGSTH